MIRTLCLADEGGERLQKAIANLPEREQQVLMLYYQQELTIREVGELMRWANREFRKSRRWPVEHLWTVL